MRPTILKTVLLLAGAAAAAPATAEDSASLVVDEAPQSPRPYVLPNMAGQTAALGNQIYRFSVTGNASGGAFTLMQTNAPASSSLGVFPHIHKTHYENFYCTKGRFQLWAQSTNDATSEPQTRLLTQGDYGAVPHNTMHTFQILDPDTQLTGVIQPGGFEVLFLALASGGTYDSAIGSPFPPNTGDFSSPGDLPDLSSFDVYPDMTYVPRGDAVNGIAGSGNWHNGSNSLAPDSRTPNFVAKGYGPRYLNSEGGAYSIVSPLVTGEQSEGNFTMGTITLSKLLPNATASPATTRYHTAFQVEEGELVVKVDGYADSARLGNGDVLFVPANTSFTYYASRAFTKFLYVSGGADGLDYDLLQNSVEWNDASYPQNAP